MVFLTVEVGSGVKKSLLYGFWFDFWPAFSKLKELLSFLLGDVFLSFSGDMENLVFLEVVFEESSMLLNIDSSIGSSMFC